MMTNTPQPYITNRIDRLNRHMVDKKTFIDRKIV